METSQAAGEAEAELANMNRLGVIDFVFTGDGDVFVFGALGVIRYAFFYRIGVELK